MTAAKTWYLIFLTALTVLEGGAAFSAMYFDWKRAVYWALAALMTASFML